jgi:methylase of polypeptide subunit release factors
MSRFGFDPLAFFNAVYEQVPPWDIGGAQPAMSALLDKFPPVDPILEAGCGSGALAIFLAQPGHEVIGIDFVEAAIEHARRKAGALPTEIAQKIV